MMRVGMKAHVGVASLSILPNPPTIDKLDKHFGLSIFGVWRAGCFVFAASGTPLHRRAVLGNIGSQKVQCSARLARHPFGGDQFAIVPIDIRFEYASRSQLVDPGLKAPKPFGRSFGIQNLCG